MMEDTDEDKKRKQMAGSHEEVVARKKQEEEDEDEEFGAKEAERSGRRKDTQLGAVILGLKIAGNHLNLVFKGHTKVTERWVFRGVELKDGRWHTLVLWVSSQRARLSLDCSAPVDM